MRTFPKRMRYTHQHPFTIHRICLKSITNVTVKKAYAICNGHLRTSFFRDMILRLICESLKLTLFELPFSAYIYPRITLFLMRKRKSDDPNLLLSILNSLECTLVEIVRLALELWSIIAFINVATLYLTHSLIMCKGYMISHTIVWVVGVSEGHRATDPKVMTLRCWCQITHSRI